MTPVTPFSEDCEQLNLKGLAENISFLVDRGIHLMYPCGHSGEFPSLSLEEWTQVLEVVQQTASGGAYVVPSVGQGLSVALEMVRRGEAMGADGFLFIPPHQAYLSDRGVAEYWKRLLDATQLPVVLYKREWPTDQALSQLMRHDRVIGVKYGGKDVAAFAAVVESSDRRVVWTCGSAELWAPFLAMAGSSGFTSGVANFAPSLALELNRALQEGAHSRAMALRARVAPFERIRARDGDANNVAAVKHAMDLVRLAGGPVRPPLRSLDDETAEDVRRAVDQLREFIEAPHAT